MANKTQSKQDEVLEVEDLLKDVPDLKPAERFRQRERSRILGLSLKLEPYLNGAGEVDLSNNDAARAMLDYLADADEFFESIAVDPDAYVAWSEGLSNSEQVFTALLNKYQVRLGE